MDLVGFLRDWRRVGKEKDEKEKEKEKEDNKIGVAEKVSTIAMPGAGLLLLFWGLQRGYPLGFIRKSAVW